MILGMSRVVFAGVRKMSFEGGGALKVESEVDHRVPPSSGLVFSERVSILNKLAFIADANCIDA